MGTHYGMQFEHFDDVNQHLITDGKAYNDYR